MTKRLVAVVQATDIHPETRHSSGMPPGLAPADEESERLPWPRILLIEGKADGVFLVRLTEDGRFSGDTWHANVDEAKEQAEREYGPLVGIWREVPLTIQDDVQIARFALSPAAEGGDSD